MLMWLAIPELMPNLIVEATASVPSRTLVETVSSASVATGKSKSHSGTLRMARLILSALLTVLPSPVRPAITTVSLVGVVPLLKET